MIIYTYILYRRSTHSVLFRLIEIEIITDVCITILCVLCLRTDDTLTTIFNKRNWKRNKKIQRKITLSPRLAYERRRHILNIHKLVQTQYENDAKETLGFSGGHKFSLMSIWFVFETNNNEEKTQPKEKKKRKRNG